MPGSVFGNAGDALFGGVPRPAAPDQANFFYGGSGGYAQNARNRFAHMGATAQGRSPPRFDASGYDAGLANDDASRGQQAAALALFGQAARGEGPSAAQAQMSSGLDQASRMQAQNAASTVGGNPLLAGRNASMVSADMQRRGINDATALRAQEQQAGMQGYGALAGQMRAADQSRAGMGLDYGRANADLQLRNRAQNDAYSQALYGNELAVNQGQLQGDMGYANTALNYGQGIQNAGLQQREQNRGFGKDVFNAFSGAGKMLFGGG